MLANNENVRKRPNFWPFPFFLSEEIFEHFLLRKKVKNFLKKIKIMLAFFGKVC